MSQNRKPPSSKPNETLGTDKEVVMERKDNLSLELTESLEHFRDSYLRLKQVWDKEGDHELLHRNYPFAGFFGDIDVEGWVDGYIL